MVSEWLEAMPGSVGAATVVLDATDGAPASASIQPLTQAETASVRANTDGISVEQPA